MPLRLVLMRHAKSSWKSTAHHDKERPLNKRGKHDAPRVGAELRHLGWVPERIVSSDSVRTIETFSHMKDALGFEGEPEWRADLYHGGVEDVCAALRELPDDCATALVLGHNPGWEDALEWLSGRHEPMKTGACALLTTTAERWSDAARAGAWTLEAMVYPRQLE
ncbi:MAG: histidine phosphatase family protein [Myxococcales bacterium]|nr:histidine phosphatase family protein [Myxococcales bacterium]